MEGRWLRRPIFAIPAPWEADLIRERGRELRRAKRTPKRNAAWIGLASGGTHIPCVLWDISASGARIAAPRPNALPVAFNLLLNKEGSAQRVCRVVWRSSKYLGVQFVEGRSADEVLESGALRRLPKVMVAEAAEQKGDAAALLLPGYGPAFLEKPERRRFAISSLAAAMVFLLTAATALLFFAGMHNGADAEWAQQVCTNTANFCEHPEWTGGAGALMTVVYLAVKGMEL
jgi:hypothetical protein